MASYISDTLLHKLEITDFLLQSLTWNTCFMIDKDLLGLTASCSLSVNNIGQTQKNNTGNLRWFSPAVKNMQTTALNSLTWRARWTLFLYIFPVTDCVSRIISIFWYHFYINRD